MRSSRERDLDGLTDVAIAAQEGDRSSLGVLSRAMQQPVYRLALRFSGHPLDAEDVALEVMLRLLTSLETYDGRSRLTMWVYTNAVRQVLRTEPRPAELVAAERGASTSGSLLGLPRGPRLAYILIDLLGFTVAEGAAICAIDRVDFQAELLAARSALREHREARAMVKPIDADLCSHAGESVWERLVAAMPSHLGAG